MHASVVFSQAYRALFDPYPLHSAVEKNDIETVRRYLSYLKECGDDKLQYELHLNKPRIGWPIYYYNFAPGYPGYEMVIELLEAGTNPELPKAFGLTLFHAAINSQYVPLFRLLLWYQPNYKHGLGAEIRIDHLITVEERIVIWNRNHPETHVKIIVEETAKEALKAKLLLEEAHSAEEVEDFAQAARKYKEVAEIYTKQSKDEIERYHGEPVIAKHYQAKANEFYKKAETTKQNYTVNPLLAPPSPRAFESSGRLPGAPEGEERDLS